MSIELIKVDYKNSTMLIADTSTGESRVLGYSEIFHLLIAGIQIKNMRLTKTGFSYILNGMKDGVKFNINSAYKSKLRTALAAQQQRDTQVKTPIKQTQTKQEVKKPTIVSTKTHENRDSTKTKAVLASGRIENKNKSQVVYRGELFLSEAALCKKFNRDIETYKKLISEGFSQDEALGLVPLRPVSALNKPDNKSMTRFLDNMENERKSYT